MAGEILEGEEGGGIHTNQTFRSLMHHDHPSDPAFMSSSKLITITNTTVPLY